MPSTAELHLNRTRLQRAPAVIRRPLRAAGVCGFLLGLLAPSIVRADGFLDTIREDVRTPSPAPTMSESDYLETCDCDDECLGDSASGNLVGWATLYGVTSPFWLPHYALGDDFSSELLFQQFPYDEAPGYLGDVACPGTRRWAGRLSSEYGSDLDDLNLLGGRLLVSTASRWGIDVQMQNLHERLPNTTRDQLWLGDGNLVLRFAQNPWMQWRAGLGLNWLDDPAGTDYGVNFTYGADWFPVRPLVLSATLDCGTLGHATLFRFRTTAGVLINRVETYIGYEYLDVDRTQLNTLLAGVQIWF